MKIVFSNLIIHNIILRKRRILKAALIFILGFSVTFAQENNKSELIDTLTVDKKVKEPLLLNNVKYDASDSIIINQKDNKIILYIMLKSFMVILNLLLD